MRWKGHITCAWGLLVLLCCVPVAARAADAAGSYQMRGIGNQSCAKFVHVMRNRDVNLETIEYQSWLEGYRTAANRYLRDVSDIVEQSNLSAFMLTLDLHCQRNATERLAHVLDGRILQMYYDRHPKAP